MQKSLCSMKVLSMLIILILISRTLSAFPKQSQWCGLGDGRKQILSKLISLSSDAELL